MRGEKKKIERVHYSIDVSCVFHFVVWYRWLDGFGWSREEDDLDIVINDEKITPIIGDIRLTLDFASTSSHERSPAIPRNIPSLKGSSLSHQANVVVQQGRVQTQDFHQHLTKFLAVLFVTMDHLRYSTERRDHRQRGETSYLRDEGDVLSQRFVPEIGFRR